MFRIKVEKYTLIASFVVHGVLGGLLAYEANQALVIGSVKGSRPSSFGGVAIEIVETVKTPKEKQAVKTFEGPSEVVVKKPVKKKPKRQAKAKKPEKKKPRNSMPKQVLVQKGGGLGAPSVIGFDLENLKGNVSPNIQNYFNSLRADIQRRQRYPRIAKRLRQTGKVLLKFQIDKTGKITNVLVEEPSPHSTLNRSAKKLISSLGRPYPLPQDLNYEKIEVTLPINYQL